MIRHLNPLNFKTFGFIFSERTPDAAAVPSNLDSIVLDAQLQDVTVYRALTDSYLFSRTNTSILSVSCDGISALLSGQAGLHPSRNLFLRIAF